MSDILYAGEDAVLDITLKGDDGNPIDLNNYSAVNALLKVRNPSGMEATQANFVWESSGFNNTITIVDAAQGKIRINIFRAASRHFMSGRATVEILAQKQDSNFPDGFHSVAIKDLFDIRQSDSQGL